MAEDTSAPQPQQTVKQPRKAYVEPKLVRLGSVADLTLGAASIGTDGSKGTQKPSA